MARHSHWHNIQLTKGKADAKRAQMFSKFAKNIAVAAKEGGVDPAFNFKLRVAVDAAKAVNMPKDNIERAIERGAGKADGPALEEVVYEGFAPGGVAMLVRCLTDNRNRTVAEVKNIVSKYGGSMGASGSVMWMFEKKGVVMFLSPFALGDRETFELAMIEAGADDILWSEEDAQIICNVADLTRVLEACEAMRVKPDAAGMEFVAKNTVTVSDPAVGKQVVELVDALEENDDVDAVFTNEG
jgi:YebC/PmpR family DNA-binding regulatory protein